MTTYLSSVSRFSSNPTRSAISRRKGIARFEGAPRLDRHRDPIFPSRGLRRAAVVRLAGERGGTGRADHRHRHRPSRHARDRSEEHTSELQSLMRISYAVFCLKKKNTTK